jgi:SAM-dependent methyltransferase
MDNAYSMAARYYDKLYAGKDYQGEVQRLVALLGVDANQKSLTLLDVACGTGRHLEYLSDFFQGEGLDSCPELLEAAKIRNPGVSFHLGDMTGFDLGTHFDVVTCLFGSIGYVKTPEKLRSAMRCMAAHLQPGGVLAIEPWFTPEKGRPNAVHAVFVDEPELKIARINTRSVKDGISVFDFHYIVGTPDGTEHFVEHHELGLFSGEEMISALKEAGLSVHYDSSGLNGRGLYTGRMRRD